MNKINTDTLRPGQVFSHPVYSEYPHLLLPALSPLRQKDIDFLFTWGIDEVSTEGNVLSEDEIQKLVGELPEELAEELTELIEDEPEGEAAEPEPKPAPAAPPPPPPPPPPEKKKPVRFSISDVSQNSGPYRAYKNLIEKLNSIFNAIKAGNDVDMRPIDAICVQLLQDLREHPDNFIDYILGGEVSGHELAKSSVNTAILAALTAQELKLPNHKINNIVAGALLHDVGMLRLHKGITEKKGALSDAELEQIKTHPLHTSKIVSKELFGPNEVNLIALQHHERWDGKGYPDHIIGPAIDMGARIVSVADAFEAMVSKKAYRNSMLGYQAIKNLMADNGRRFDPTVIMAFTKLIGIYPIGSIVKLNDGSVARVVSVHRDTPLRPKVQMVVNKEGKALRPGEGATVDLLTERTLFIKNAIDPEEYNTSNA
jgi:HD-GYP domain-containing protein (c-di-GMP phosphodiesterase class II)